MEDKKQWCWLWDFYNVAHGFLHGWCCFEVGLWAGCWVWSSKQSVDAFKNQVLYQNSVTWNQHSQGQDDWVCWWVWKILFKRRKEDVDQKCDQELGTTCMQILNFEETKCWWVGRHVWYVLDYLNVLSSFFFICTSWDVGRTGVFLLLVYVIELRSLFWYAHFGMLEELGCFFCLFMSLNTLVVSFLVMYILW